MAKEQWKEIPRFPGHFVSNRGRVRRKTGRLWRYFSTPDEYGAMQQVQFNIDGTPHGLQVSRLVGAAFCPDYKSSLVAGHKDGDKSNCRASNLLWLTRSQLVKAALAAKKEREAARN